MLSLLLLLAAAPLPAAETPLLAAQPDSALLNEVLELRPAPGHHFSAEAPQKCGGERAWEVLPRRFRCRLSRAGAVPVVASVCDDAKTYCRQARFELRVSGPVAPPSASPLQAPPPSGFRAPEGFVSNDPAAALARAKKEGKQLFIHFGAIWCPPCNELEEHAYPHPAFRAAAKDFVLLALDADAANSFDWKARFKVAGYPTLLVADSSLREIGRVVGARSGPGLAKFLSEMSRLRGEPVARSTDPLRLARWRLERGEFDEVERLLAPLSQAGARKLLLESREERARRAGDSEARARAARRLIAEFPEDVQLARWANVLAASDKPAAAELRDAVAASVRRWSAAPELGETPYSPGELLLERAAFTAAVESTAAARPIWLEAAAAYAALAAASPLGARARGANFSRAHALRQAGEYASAVALLDSLASAYPSEFTFHYLRASALKGLGEKAKAHEAAAEAVERGYGDNWLRAVRLKAELELELGRPRDAARTIDEALAEAVLPASADVRTFNYVSPLRALRAEIAKKL